MDSLTQILLGAAVGEAAIGKKAGNKALLWGGICGTIPDLDVIGRYFMDTVDALDFHRGMTHSILFAIILSPVLGYLIHAIHRSTPASWRDWTWLAFLGLFTHPLLDCFTTWGTQLFWPFSDYRVAIKSVFVIDPFYTVPLLVCLIWLSFLRRDSRKPRVLNYTGLALSSSYLLVTLVLKAQVNNIIENSAAQQKLRVLRYDTKPAPFSTILWAATLETDSAYHIGYYSFLDEDKDVRFFSFDKNHEVLGDFQSHLKVKKLLKISDGWFTVENSGQGIIINDLRFGQRSGWETGEGKFVFSYRVFNKGEEVVIEEVEKDFGEGKKMLKPLWNRILGG